MLGIIAAIIAFKKGHKTFGAFLCAWEVLALVIMFAVGPNAVLLPGGLFLIIAMGMEKETDPNEQLDLTKRYICKACGSYSPEPLSRCPQCGDQSGYKDRYSKIAVPIEKRFKCRSCGAEFSERQDRCPSCGVGQYILERPTIPFVRDIPEDAGRAMPAGTNAIPQNTAASDIPKISDDGIPEEIGSTEASGDLPAKETIRTQEAPVAKFCRECGAKLTPDVIFCPHCGTKVIMLPRSKDSAGQPGRSEGENRI